MHQRQIRPDRGLTIRMILSFIILGAVYLAFMWVLLSVGLGIAPIILIAGGMLIVQYYFSDSVVLMSVGARKVPPGERPELRAMIERLAAMAGVPTPQIAILDTSVPNAFATGRNPRHSVICVTTGLLSRLDPKELEAVVAHEMTHVRNRDMTIITMATFFATVAGFIVQWAFFFIPMGGMGGGMGGGRRNGDSTILVYLVSFLVWIISFFIIRAISRYREYAADRGSAVLTGQPSELASALVKISGGVERSPNRDLREVEKAAALCIMPAISRDSFLELFQTHPSLNHRLDKLKEIEREMGR